ncbi:hypothetical protein PHYBOEH_003329 [Phytophthora boehmeriae]|uniref:Uncharacterized protein n=1 Tax=Phytophthora boehmeriae TaxID=109152 RepID=A0A8T1WVM7_9STRA|nr:hypothetical protein PHYBOEH_003329 [Phytophthora boehmeriae]
MTTRGDVESRRQGREKNSLSMATTSQRLAASTNKNKNWRANYLRALNIFTPDLQTSTRGRHVSSGDSRRPNAASGRSRRATTATDQVPSRPVSSNSSNTRGRPSGSTSTSGRQSSRSGSSRSHSRTRGSSPADEKPSTYVFGLRQHLFRARRTPRSELTVVDRVSAPIEIPTGVSVTSPTEIPTRADKLSGRRDSSSRRQRGSSNCSDFQNSTDKQQPMQLLSWEEPSVMLGNGAWSIESDKRNERSAGVAIPVDRSRRSSRPYEGIAEECEDTEDDEPTHPENEEDDDIFKMEFDGEDSSASRNVFRGTRASSERRRGELHRRIPGGLDGFDDDDEENDVVQPLSASFVPPHQMVERGCFSLGLRDELKRKPGLHI